MQMQKNHLRLLKLYLLYDTSLFFCLFASHVGEIFPQALFVSFFSPDISQDVGAVNRFTFPHSKVFSAYDFTRKSGLSSPTLFSD